MNFQIPPTLKAEHEELHGELSQRGSGSLQPSFWSGCAKVRSPARANGESTRITAGIV